jgi:hexulose-6-phosphate isomerase
VNRREVLGLAGAAGATLIAGRARAAAPDRRPKKSLILSMLPADLPLEERFALGKSVGFDGIEIAPTFNPDEQKALRAASDKAGLPIHSIIFGGWKKPLTHQDPQVAAEGLEEVRQGLACAKAVGADNLLLVPGIVNAQVRYTDAWERARKQIKQVVPLAAKLKVVIAIEEVWNDFLLSPLEMVRFVDDFHSPWVRAYFDVGNVVRTGYPQDWIRTLGKRINRVHLKDFKRKENKFVGLGEGDVDWPEVKRALGEAGFASYCTAELGKGDEAYLRDVAGRIDKIFDGTLARNE